MVYSQEETLKAFANADLKELEEWLEYYTERLNDRYLSPKTHDYFEILYRHAAAELLTRRHDPHPRATSGYGTPEYWVCMTCGRNAVRPEKLLKWRCRT